jgi:hypothetical protein
VICQGCAGAAAQRQCVDAPLRFAMSTAKAAFRDRLTDDHLVYASCICLCVHLVPSRRGLEAVDDADAVAGLRIRACVYGFALLDQAVVPTAITRPPETAMMTVVVARPYRAEPIAHRILCDDQRR